MPLLVVLTLSLSLFFLTGFGLSLQLVATQGKQRVLDAALLAPVIGFAAVGLTVGSVAVVLNLPVSASGWPVTVGLFVISATLTINDIRLHREDYRFDRIPSRGSVATFIAVVLLVLALPTILMIRLGLRDTFYQGNVADAGNYMTMAWYLKHIPWPTELNPATHASLLAQYPAYTNFGLATRARPFTSFVIAWMSTLSGRPIYTVYYVSNLLGIFLALVMVIALGRQLKLHKGLICLSAVAIAAGYWMYQVLDIDASSQIDSIPLLLLVLYAWQQLEARRPVKLFGKERILLGASLAALLSFYTEILPITILALGIYYLWRLLAERNRQVVSEIVAHWATVAVALIVILPTFGITSAFLRSQTNFVLSQSSVSDSWALAYYSALWQDNAFIPVLPGLWGQYYFAYVLGDILPQWGAIWFLLAAVVPLALSGILIYGLASTLFKHHDDPAPRIQAAGVMAFWGIGFLIWAGGQRPWLAGKALTFGYPIVFLFIFTTAQQWLIERKNPGTRLKSWLSAIALVTVAIWSASQFATAALRAYGLITFKPNLILFSFATHPGFRTLGILLSRDNSSPPHLAADDITDTTQDTGDLLEFDQALRLAYSEDYQYYAVRGLPAYWFGPAAEWQNITELPDQYIVQRSRDYLGALGLGKQTYQDDQIAVYNVTPQDIDLMLVGSDPIVPDENSPVTMTNASPTYKLPHGRPARALSDGSSTIRFLASGQRDLAMSMQFIPEFGGDITFYMNDKALEKQVVVREQRYEVTLCLPVVAGTNSVRIEASNINRIRPDDGVSMALTNLLFGTSGSVDVGSIADQRFIGSGWQTRENWPGETVRWASRTAGLTLITCGPPGDSLILQMRAFNPQASTQKVSYQLNNTQLPDQYLAPGWNLLRVPISSTMLNPGGLQTLVMDHHSVPLVEGDSRKLTIAYDWVAITDKSCPITDSASCITRLLFGQN